MYAYTVGMQFQSAPCRLHWQHWLLEEHLRDVLRAGALRAELVELSETALEARYLFADADAYAAYERDHAPRLRAEGLRKATETGEVTFVRSTGVLHHVAT